MTNAVHIENFNYSYSDGTLALEEINITIPHGQKVALIGPNGAGKSTLLLAMGCFLRGTGRVEIDGLENTKKNITQIRYRLGAVFQNPDEQLFMPKLIDDVAFGPLNMGLSEEEVLKRSCDALKKVGLAGLEDKEPHHLSAGQKRSAAIATILSMMPKIITMDEPDSNLDPRNRNNLIDLLNGFHQTLIIASCSMNFISRVCERVILLDAGRIVADGPAREIMSDSLLMEEHGLESPTVWA